jgi:hypothetical protein
MNARSIYTGPADGWGLVITARPALGRWIVKFEYTKNGQAKTRTGAWLACGRWVSTRFSPDGGSDARAIAEAWLKAHPVPAPGRVVTAKVVPGLDFRGVKP